VFVDQAFQSRTEGRQDILVDVVLFFVFPIQSAIALGVHRPPCPERPIVAEIIKQAIQYRALDRRDERLLDLAFTSAWR
jgi:hypothetical protein